MLSHMELKSAVLEQLELLQEAGHRAYIPRGDHDYAVDVGVRMLTLRNILTDDEGVLSANPEEDALLRYYANSIAHLPARTGNPAKPAVQHHTGERTTSNVSP